MVKKPLVKFIILFVILQLYFPISKLWHIRNIYYDNGFFKQVISKKFIEENKKKIKNKIIKKDIKSILSIFNSLDEKDLIKLKNISKEELNKKIIKNPKYYYFKGLLYFAGVEFNSNFEQNFTLSYESFKKAKETTNSSKLLEYLNPTVNGMLTFGIGVNANPTQGFQNYLHYKTSNTDLKQYNQLMIGDCYLFGIGTEQNFNKAYKHFNNAGKYAYEVLAFMYSGGIGVDRNINKALELINKMQGKDKDFNIAMIYISNNDYTKGKYYLQKCSKTSKKCQELYPLIFKYSFYDKVLNIMSYI